MSRSYKHTPISKTYGPYRNAKRMASKAVRRKMAIEEHVKKSNFYKKLYDSWDIYDYVSYAPECDKKWWFKYYRRK